MPDILIVPGAPFYLLALAGALLAALGARLIERRPLALGPARPALAPPARLAAGQAAGLGLAALLIAVAAAGNVEGQARALLLAGALAGYLAFGLVLPRRPEQRRRREAAALRRLTPGLIAFVRVALGSFEAPGAALARYVARPSPRRAAMQALVAEAAQLSQDQRLRPFAALAAAARAQECRELTDVAEALAQAEAEGGPIETVLAAQQETLELVLQSEFKRLLRRRTVYLLLMVAVSLVLGVLVNLLFVMTGGGSALTQL